jgi:cell filamentation protein
VIFDPFGDYAERGYLRNIAGERNPEIVKQVEHASFRANAESAMNELALRVPITPDAVAQVHKTIFQDVYPWAGQTRDKLVPGMIIEKAGDPYLFARTDMIANETKFALDQGNDPAFMRARPGEVMGGLAFAHPFLEGNGRTIMVVHSVLAQRAGISVEWEKTNKEEYLQFLTAEMKVPGKGHLDTYLKPFVKDAISQTEQLQVLLNMKALGPGSELASLPPNDQKIKPQSL